MHQSLTSTARLLAISGLLMTLFFAGFWHSTTGILTVALLYVLSNALATIYILLHPRRGGISFMISFFFTMIVSVPALVQISLNEFPSGSYYSLPELGGAYFVLSLAQLSYFVSELIVSTRVDFDRSKSERVLNKKYYWRIAISLSFLCVLLSVYIGTEVLFMNRAGLGAGFATEGTFKHQMLNVGRALSLFAFIIIIYLRVWDRASRNRRLYLISAVLIAPVFMILNYPLGSPRFMLFGCIIAIAATTFNFFDTRIKTSGLVLAVVSILTIFPAIKLIGYSDSPVDFIVNMFNIEPTRYLVRVDFDAFQQIADTIIYLREGGQLRWGNNFLGVVLFFVPRAWWPGKPIDSGEIVSLNLGYWYTNVANPLPAEALISFSYPGIVLVFVLLGWVVTKVESAAKSAVTFQRINQDLFIYSLSMGFAVIILRGSLNGVAPMFASAFLAYFLIRHIHDNYSNPKLRL